MNKPNFHHFLSILFALPIFIISILLAIDSPELLNPWSKEPFGGMWILVLPALIASFCIIVNSAIAMKSTRG